MNVMTNSREFAIDPRGLRETLSCFPTGVAIATTLSRSGAPIGVTISSFNSVSMDPPLILWSLARKAGSLPEYKAHPGFAINILSADQADLCKLFASAERDRFTGLDWVEGAHGVPCIAGCAATLECETHAVQEGGDHEIFIGRVLAHTNSDRTPLAFGKGQLGAFFCRLTINFQETVSPSIHHGCGRTVLLVYNEFFHILLQFIQKYTRLR